MPSEATLEQTSDFQRDTAAISELMDTVPEAGTVAPDAAPQVPEAQVTMDPKPPVAPELPEDEEKLDEYLNTFQPKTPDQQKALPTLKSHIKNLKGELKGLKQELETVKADSSKVEPLTEEIKNELKELRQLRRSEDPSKDPEFQQKFITPAQQKEEQAYAILRGNNLRPEVIEMIKKAGGLAAVSRSEEEVPKDLHSDKTWSEWVEDVLFAKSPFADRKRLETILTDILGINDQMAAEIQDAKVNSESRMQAKYESMGKEFQSGLEEIRDSLGNMAQKWEVKPGASPEDKAAAEEHNKTLDEVVGVIQGFQKNLNSPKAVGRMAAMAGQSVYLMKSNARIMAINEQLQGTIKELNEKLEKIKGSSSAARRTNAPLVTVQPANKMQTAKQAIEGYLTEIDNA